MNFTSGALATDEQFTSPAEVVAWLDEVTTWLQRFKVSSTFNTALPFTGASVGTYFDFPRVWQETIFSQLTYLEPPPSGVLGSGPIFLGSDSVFKFQIDSELPVNIKLPGKLPGENYAGINDIALKLNNALTLSGLSGKVTAVVTGGGTTGLPTRLVFRLASGNGSALTLNIASGDPAVTVLGFASVATALPYLNPQYIKPGILGNPDYIDLEALATKIETLGGTLNSGVTGVTVGYSGGKKLTIQMKLDGTYTSAVDLSLLGGGGTKFPTTLGDLTGLTVEGEIDLAVKPTLALTLGFDLNFKTTPALVAGFTPTNGQLAAAAKFSIQLNGGTAVLVTVPADPTNATVADLVADFNAAIGATALNGIVEARSTSGGLIVLAVVNPDLDGDGRVDAKEDLPQPGSIFPLGDKSLDFKEGVGPDLDGDFYVDPTDEDLDGDGRLDLAETGPSTTLGVITSMRVIAATPTDPIATQLLFNVTTPVRSTVQGWFLDEYNATTPFLDGTITYFGQYRARAGPVVFVHRLCGLGQHRQWEGGNHREAEGARPRKYRYANHPRPTLRLLPGGGSDGRVLDRRHAADGADHLRYHRPRRLVRYGRAAAGGGGHNRGAGRHRHAQSRWYPQSDGWAGHHADHPNRRERHRLLCHLPE